MTNIFNSASKIVFVLIAIAVVGLTYLGKVDAKDFMILASMVFAYYFTKSVPSNTAL